MKLNQEPPRSLKGMEPREVMDYLLSGGNVIDDTDTADRLLSMAFALRDTYYEIVPIGLEYVLRTPAREFEALRVPRTIGGVMLMVLGFDKAVERCGLYIATGGAGGF